MPYQPLAPPLLVLTQQFQSEIWIPFHRAVLPLSPRSCQAVRWSKTAKKTIKDQFICRIAFRKRVKFLIRIESALCSLFRRITPHSNVHYLLFVIFELIYWAFFTYFLQCLNILGAKPNNKIFFPEFKRCLLPFQKSQPSPSWGKNLRIQFSHYTLFL